MCNSPRAAGLHCKPALFCVDIKIYSCHILIPLYIKYKIIKNIKGRCHDVPYSNDLYKIQINIFYFIRFTVPNIFVEAKKTDYNRDFWAAKGLDYKHVYRGGAPL